VAEEKPHEATQSKLQKQRKEGNVARSTEISGTASFGAATFTALAIMPTFVPIFRDWLVNVTSQRPIGLLPPTIMLALVFVPMIAAILASALFTILQTAGPVLKPIKVEFKNLNPASGFKKIFSKHQVVQAIRAFASFGLAITVALPIVKEVFAKAIGTSSPTILAQIIAGAISRLVGTALVLGLVFAFADFFLQYRKFKHDQKMTFEELKREHKENNGDPHVKGRRKQLGRQMLRAPRRSLATANVVVTNPTHFAVALEYRPPEVPIPRVVARACDDAAQEVKAQARELGITMIENVPLARGLFARCMPGDEIPEDTYVAVAEIIAALARHGVSA